MPISEQLITTALTGIEFPHSPFGFKVFNDFSYFYLFIIVIRWYSEKFVKGQWDKEECVAEWKKYRACLSVRFVLLCLISSLCLRINGFECCKFCCYNYAGAFG